MCEPPVMCGTAGEAEGGEWGVGFWGAVGDRMESLLAG